MSEPRKPIWQERGGAYFLRMGQGASIMLSVGCIAGSLWRVDCKPFGRTAEVSGLTPEEVMRAALVWLRTWLEEAQETASGRIDLEDPPQGGSMKGSP